MCPRAHGRCCALHRPFDNAETSGSRPHDHGWVLPGQHPQDLVTYRAGPAAGAKSAWTIIQCPPSFT